MFFSGLRSYSWANFALQRTALDNQTYFESNIVNTALNHLYTEDCLESVRYEEDAIVLAHLHELLHRDGSGLTKFTSNNTNMLSSITESRPTKFATN